MAGWVVGKLESNAKLNSKVKVEVEVEVGERSSIIQGDSKKTQEFSLITRTVVVYELYHEIINRLFLKKTEIHTQILNTEPFLCYFRGQRFLTNKMVL